MYVGEKCFRARNLLITDNTSFPVATTGSLSIFENPAADKIAKCTGVTKAKKNDGFEDRRPDKKLLSIPLVDVLCLHRLSSDNRAHVHLFT